MYKNGIVFATGSKNSGVGKLENLQNTDPITNEALSRTVIELSSNSQKVVIPNERRLHSQTDGEFLTGV